MPRTAVEGFIGGSNRQAALTADAERTVNLFLAPTQSGNAKAPVYLRRRPGLRPFAAFDDSPGEVIFYQNGRTFVIIGTTFGEVDSSGTTTVWGTVAAAQLTLPAWIVGNGTAGHQIFLGSGGHGYIFDINANTFIEITAANFPGTGFPSGTAAGGEFLDGYFIVLVVNSRQFLISALDDGTSWDPLDVAERSEAADNIMAMRRNHRELWFLGNETSEIWYDSGDALFPFAPVPGTFLEVGTCAFSTARVAIGDKYTIAWVSRDERGIGSFMVASGYENQAVSTHAVDAPWQASADLATTRIFAVQMSGFNWIVVSIADLPTSWVTDGTQPGSWVEWAVWNTTTCTYEPFIGNSHAFAFNKHLVTDRLSGNIYEWALDAYTDSVVS